MRRKDREVTDPQRIDAILRACHCCRLGFYDNGEVYIVPLDFGYDEKEGKRTFYFHGAKEGRKMDCILRSPRAGFELDTGYELIEAEVACRNSARYRSVVGTGRVSVIEAPEEKRAALQAVMLHSTGKGGWDFPDAMLNAVCVFQLEVETLSCKEHA